MVSSLGPSAVLSSCFCAVSVGAEFAEFELFGSLQSFLADALGTGL